MKITDAAEGSGMIRITGETQLLCVIGDPVAHSLSPYIHNTFVADCRRAGIMALNCVYLAFPIPRDSLAAFVRAAKVLNIRGFNVTMPHKEAIVPYIDVMSEEVRCRGVANTVAIRDGVLHGCNTDGEGFVRAIGWTEFEMKGKSALILGRGGAAKTIALALEERGMHVCMAARSRSLPVDIQDRVRGVLWEEIGREACFCDVLVNATPLGMQGRGNGQEDFDDFSFLGSLPEGALVADLVYAPRQTRLLAQARERGLRVMNGIAHLVHQAALAFEFFTGVMPSEACIERVLRELGQDGFENNR